MAPVSRKRGPGDLRRKRLTQLLNHENGKIPVAAGPPSPVLRGAKSLPKLPSLNSTKSATLDFDVALVPTTTEQATQLSPLKITRRTDLSIDQAFVSFPDCDRPASIEAQFTEVPMPNPTTSSKIFPAKTNTSRPSTRAQLDRGAFTPMKGSREQNGERANSNAIRIHQQDAAARRLEISRRRATVTAASQSLFDRLATLPIREAIQLLEAQREALLDFSMQQFRGLVDADESNAIQAELLKTTAKVGQDLQTRLGKLQQEELQASQKKQALQQLKIAHQDEIQHHLATAKEQRKQELAARENIVKEQERLDKNFVAREVKRKLDIGAHSEKLAEQIKNNAAAKSPFKLTVQGSSPLYRTPWWSDESDERVQGFQRPVAVQAPMQSPVIHSKQRCQWYD